MKSFKDYVKETERKRALAEAVDLFEHETYKSIPGTANSYRKDPVNTTTLTQQHVHVYAKKNGGGKELYSANIDGSGHDGSSGYAVPAKHAEYLRGLGYSIPIDNVLECISLNPEDKDLYSLVIMEDQELLLG